MPTISRVSRLLETAVFVVPETKGLLPDAEFLGILGECNKEQ